MLHQVAYANVRYSRANSQRAIVRTPGHGSKMIFPMGWVLQSVVQSAVRDIENFDRACFQFYHRQQFAIWTERPRTRIRHLGGDQIALTGFRQFSIVICLVPLPP